MATVIFYDKSYDLSFNIQLDDESIPIYEKYEDKLYISSSDGHLKVKGTKKQKLIQVIIGNQTGKTLVCDNRIILDLRAENWFYGTMSDVRVRSSEGFAFCPGRNKKKPWKAFLRYGDKVNEQKFFETKTRAQSQRIRWEKKYCSFNRINEAERAMKEDNRWDVKREDIEGTIQSFKYDYDENILKVVFISKDTRKLCLSTFFDLNVASRVLGRFIQESLTPDTIMSNAYSHLFVGLNVNYNSVDDYFTQAVDIELSTKK